MNQQVRQLSYVDFFSNYKNNIFKKGNLVHMDNALDPPSPLVDWHGQFRNPPSPLPVHVVYEWPQTIVFIELQPNFCCEKQILADHKMNVEYI